MDQNKDMNCVPWINGGYIRKKNNKLILKVHEVKKHCLWLFFKCKIKTLATFKSNFNTAQRDHYKKKISACKNMCVFLFGHGLIINASWG